MTERLLEASVPRAASNGSERDTVPTVRGSRRAATNRSSFPADRFSRPPAPLLALGARRAAEPAVVARADEPASQEPEPGSAPLPGDAGAERGSLRELVRAFAAEPFRPTDSWREQPLTELGRCLEPLLEPEEPCPTTQRTPESEPPSRPVSVHSVLAVGGTTVCVRGTSPTSSHPEVRVDTVAADDEWLGESFFRQLDSVPPTVETLAPEPDAECENEVLSVRAATRRLRLRRGVGAVVAAVAAAIVGLVGYGATGGARSVSVAEAAPARATLVARQAPADGSGPARAAELARQVSQAAAEGLGVDKPAAEPLAELTSEAARAALAAKTVELLVRRALPEAEQSARALVAAHPTDAFGYLCLGAALQDQGKWAAAVEVFGECVSHADHGDRAECAALGGKRR